MLDALVSGTTDPELLAELARGRLRAKLPALREALEGRFEAHHALVIGAILAHLDFLDEHIERLTDAIEAELGPTGRSGVALAATITGVAARTAEIMVAEIGTDMRVFPTARHLASWAGGCPGNDRRSHQEALVPHPFVRSVDRDRLRADHACGRSITLEPHASLIARRSPAPLNPYCACPRRYP